MALQIIPQYDLGEKVGSGLGEGLAALAKFKLDSLVKQKQQSKRAEIYKKMNIDPAIAGLPEEQQLAFMKEYGLRNGYPQYQQQEAPQQSMEQSGQPDIQSIISQLENQPRGPQSGMENLQAILNQGALGQMLGGMQQNPEFQPKETQNTPVLQPSQGMNPRRLSPETESRNKIAQERLDLSREKNSASEKRAEEDRKFKEFQAIKPFLHQKAEEVKNQQNIKSKAKEALKILKEHGKSFPGTLKGNLPGAAQSILIRDPNVRKYMALLNELVLARVHSRRGIPSKYKIMMEEAAKANINQPVKTQEGLLNFFIDDADKSLASQRFISSQKNEKGEYPLDIEQRASEYELSQENPMDYPQYYRDNTIYEDDNGKRFILKKGEWKPWEK